MRYLCGPFVVAAHIHKSSIPSRMEWEFVALRPDGGTVVGPRLQPERIQEWVEEVLAGTLAEEKLANNAKMVPPLFSTPPKKLGKCIEIHWFSIILELPTLSAPPKK